MGLIALECQKCGAQLSVDSQAATYTCKYCQTTHAMVPAGGNPTPGSLLVVATRACERGELGKAMQFIEQGLAIEPHDEGLLALEATVSAGLTQMQQAQASGVEQIVQDTQKISEAEQYKLQAEFILHELQANQKVYGSNSALSGATPANVDLALQYVDRCVELFPDNPVYLNLKALLLWEGKGDRAQAQALLTRAAELNPRDINIQNNLKLLQSGAGSGCFIATAAYGSPLAAEVDVLRRWRDETLLPRAVGRFCVACYYRLSPPVADFIRKRPMLKAGVRTVLRPLIRTIRKRAH